MADVTYYAGPFRGIDVVKAACDPQYAIHDGDDFVRLGLDTDSFLADYLATGDAGYTLALLASDIGGILNLTCDGDDNDELTFTRGRVGGQVKCTLNSGKPVAFEARLKVVEVADLGFFVGLSEEALGADLLADNTGAIASKDLIGFHIDTAAPTTVDAIYRLAGADAVVAGAGVLTNDAEYHTFGFRFDGAAKLEYFVDRVQVAVADLAAASFPTGEELTFTCGIKTGEGVEKSVYLDWFKAVQLR